jgi:hypothetical protein
MKFTPNGHQGDRAWQIRENKPRSQKNFYMKMLKPLRPTSRLE